MRAAFPRRCVVGVLFGMFLAFGLGFAGCTRAPDPWKDAKAGQKHILVTFPPLYALTHAVAGDDAYVLAFLSTDGPHEYQFSPADAIKAKDAHLLVYNGLQLDNRFVSKIKANLRKELPMLEVGATLPESMLLPMGKDEDDDDAKDDGKHEGHHHHHGDHDPHIWLGPPQAMAIADAIGKKLAEIDAAHADGYLKRTAQLKDQLTKLHAEGKERFKDKKNRKVLTMHDSFGYFAKAFGLEVAGTIQAQPGQDPDAARLSMLMDLCKKRAVAAVTFEPQFNDAQPRMLAKQLKTRGLAVQVAEFDPLETAPLDASGVNPAPGYYFDKMRANIDNLAKALP